MSVIYMIKCLDETVPEIYIGSTSNFIRRRKQHFYSCNNPNSHCYNLKLYRFIRSKGGFDNFTFEVIEECSNEDKFEIEKMYIEMYQPELNTNKYNFDKKEWIKEYREKNKEKNKERKKEYDKEYHEKNKDIICCRTCRCEISKKGFKEHCRTKKHINNMKQPEKLDNI